MLLALLVIVAWSTLAPAVPVTPQLVAGYDFACLLGESVGHAVVQCWDPNGNLLRVPELVAPTLLASTPHDVCVVEGDRVICWEYQLGKRIIGVRGGYQGRTFVPAGDNFAGRVERAFTAFRSIRFLSGGFDRDFCLGDSEGLLHCFGERQVRQYSSLDNQYHPHRNPSPLAREAPKLSGVIRVALNAEMGCAITQDKHLHCWAGGSSDNERAECAQDLVSKTPRVTDPLEVALPAPDRIHNGYGDSYNNCKACVVDGSEVRCWEGAEQHDERVYPSEMRDLVSPHGLLLESTGSYPCVISGHKLVCLRGDLNQEDGWNRR